MHIKSWQKKKILISPASFANFPTPTKEGDLSLVQGERRQRAAGPKDHENLKEGRHDEREREWASEGGNQYSKVNWDTDNFDLPVCDIYMQLQI